MTQPPVVEISALRNFPETTTADLGTQHRLLSLVADGRRFVVLSGPPGVGKTRAAEDLVRSLVATHNQAMDVEIWRLSNLFPDYQTRLIPNSEIESKVTTEDVRFVWEIVVLHPQYAYEDLIRGNRITQAANGSPAVEVREGSLGFLSRVSRVVEQVHSDEDIQLPNSLLVLDEINRAPIGQLFGEGIYALDRRGQPVATPYSVPDDGPLFVIPESVLMLGTMNSIDRAISGIDFALKRRFSALSMEPDVSFIVSRYEAAGCLPTVVAAYEVVQEMIAGAQESGAVSRNELRVGHSYYLAPGAKQTDDEILDWLSRAIKYQVLPLLLDYREQGLIQFDQIPQGASMFTPVLVEDSPSSQVTESDIRAWLDGLVDGVVTEVDPSSADDGQ